MAIILVVLGHVIGGYTGNYSDARYQNIVQYGLKIIYAFHMPLFFMISGYVYALREKAWDIQSYKSYVIKKAHLLLIPYFICSIGQILVKLPLQGKISSVLSWKDIFFLPIKPVDQFWYIYVLFFMFCLQPLLEMIHKDSILLTVLLFIVGKAVAFCGGGGINEWCVVPIKLLSFYFYFYIGVLYRKNKIRYSKRTTVAFLLLFGLTLYLLIRYSNRLEIISIAMQIVVAVFGSLAVISLCQSVEVVGNSRLLSLLGQSSMMIYIIHVLLCAAIRIILLKLGIEIFYISVVIGTALSLLIPVIFDLFWKRLKVKIMSEFS